MTRNAILKVLLWTATVGLLPAQTPTLQMGTVYVCPSVQALMKVYSCAGPAATDMCDVQTANARGNVRGKATRQQVMTLLALCRPQTAVEAQAAGKAASAAPASGSRPASGAGGFKVGDDVQILTAGGWMTAKVLQVNGNAYFVHAENGGDVQKTYPAELRRIGKLTAEDHAAGQWELHDKVQVTVNGKVMEGEISGYTGNDFDVRVPGGTVHTNVQNLRMSTAPPPACPCGRRVSESGTGKLLRQIRRALRTYAGRRICSHFPLRKGHRERPHRRRRTGIRMLDW